MPSETDNKRTKPVFKIAANDDQEKFKPLPKPSGTYPYRFELKDLLPGLSADKLVFHICGDTGGLVSPYYKHRMVEEMVTQCHTAAAPDEVPQFCFHLGDVVYHFGQAREYAVQFFEPFEKYPAPIFAIAGNHDADIDPTDPVKPNSLDAFMEVFCNTQPVVVPFSGSSKRKSNTQPNIYWTLKTPLADIVGLYSNIPRFGAITEEQKEWFIEELKSLAGTCKEKALILCLHHSAYSADINHGSSRRMQGFLENAFKEANVMPDVVFSGHVHNYQRFSKYYPDGSMLPFVVSGAGGFAELHKIAPLNDPAFPDTSPLLQDVVLEKYCDTRHGFIKIAITKNIDGVAIKGAYYTIPQENETSSAASLFDSFEIKAGEHFKNRR